jgi:hypothetical protein
MTLLKEKLERAIAEWEAPAGKQLFQPTNNVTRTTFNIIRDNPGITKKQAVQKLSEANFNPASTSSLIAQMIKQRLVRDESGELYANFSEYTPLKSRSNLNRKQQTRVVKKVAPPVKRDPAFDVNAFIENLTILQAKELRDKLNHFFK